MFIFPSLSKMCYKIIAQMKYETIGIVIVLIVLIAITAVLIIPGNNKHFAGYFYLSYNGNKHVLKIISLINFLKQFLK